MIGVRLWNVQELTVLLVWDETVLVEQRENGFEVQAFPKLVVMIVQNCCLIRLRDLDRYLGTYRE